MPTRTKLEKSRMFLVSPKSDQMYSEGEGAVNTIMVFIKWKEYSHLGMGVTYDPIGQKFYLLESYTETRDRNHPSGDGLTYYDVTDLGVIPKSKKGFSIDDPNLLKLLAETGRLILSEQEVRELTTSLTEWHTRYHALIEIQDRLTVLGSPDDEQLFQLSAIFI